MYTEKTSRKQLCLWLDLDPNELHRFIKREGMERKKVNPSRGVYKTKEVCEWIAINKKNGKLRSGAIGILNAIKNTVPSKKSAGKTKSTTGAKKSKASTKAAAMDPSEEKEKPPLDVQVKFATGHGLEAAVSRAREIELAFSKIVENAFNEKPLLAVDHFDAWQKSQANLLKIEKELDAILLKRKSVVNMDECSKVFFAMMGPVKAQLKSLGPDLSLDLAGMTDSNEIGVFITEKIRKVFQKISEQGKEQKK